MAPPLIGLGLAALLTTTPAGGDALPLPGPGVNVERGLRGDEVHRYRFAPSRDEEVWLVVDQDGVDVTVAVGAASAEPSLAVDSPTGRWGEEWLLVPVRAGAEFEVEIRPLSGESAPGRYRLRVEPRPAATGSAVAAERAAERAASEAGRLNRIGTRQAKARALELYREALAGWRAAGRSGAAARALLVLAVLHRQADTPGEAAPLLRQSLAGWRALGDRRGEAQTLLEIAANSLALGESAEVERTCREALAIWRALGDLQGQALTLNQLGLALAREAPRRAREPYEEALALFRRLGDLPQEAVVLNNLGGIDDLLGEPGPALARFERALALHRRRGDRRQQAAAWNNVASVHRRTGRLHEALTGYGAALEILRDLGDLRGQGRVLNNLGLTRLGLGDAALAGDLLREALALRRQSEDRRGEAITLHNLGLVAADLGDWDGALESWTEALALRRALGDRDGEATARVALGRAEGRLGHAAAALGHLEAALGLLAETGNPWRVAQARWTLGEVLTGAGRTAEAVAALERALAGYREAGDGLGESEALLALARAERAGTPGREDAGLAAAYSHAVAALDLLEASRAEVDSLGLRASFLARHAAAFELGVDLAMALDRRTPGAGWAAKALAIAERARARSLLDLLRESGAGLWRSGGDARLARRQELLARLTAKVEVRRGLLERQGPPAEDARLAREARQLRARLDELDDEIRRRGPGWEAVVRPRPLAADAVRELLDRDTTLLEFALGGERSFVWVVTAQRIEGFELPARAAIEAAAREVHERLRIHDPRAARADLEAAARLSGMLLSPVAGRLTGRRLAIVADGALHYLPLAALPHPAAPDEPLVARHEIVLLPSASALAVQRRRLAGRPPATRALAVLADPVFGAPDPRLPAGAAVPPTVPPTGEPAGRDAPAAGPPLERLAWSRWEAETIAALAGAGQARVALGFDADLAAVRRGALAGVRTVHFATHGQVDSEHPELSALVLSLVDRQGRPQDGFLRLPDLYGLDLDADLVVLSGCRTALGQEVRGEGLIGLTRGFFAAGARSLVASLWRVQDRPSAELMERFYRHLLDRDRPLRPAAALRQAQLETMRRPDLADPYFWAAFAAYGDWR